jgi:hypothetical protein
VRARFLLAALGLASLALPYEIAYAEASSTASAQAAELFEEGRVLLQKQDFRAACPKFADSAALEPKVGTLLNLADCEEHLGRIVAARGHWQDAANHAHSVNDEREKIARERFAALDPRVAKLTVSLAPSVPAGTHVTRDGVPLGAGSVGATLPVDPGTHTVAVSAPGYAPRSYEVTLADGQAKELSVEPGLKLPDEPLAPPPSRTQKTAALVTAGAGVVGIAVGSTFGVLALTEFNKSNSTGPNGGHCVGSACPQSDGGSSERATAYHEGNVSTVAFVAGGAFLAAGVVLWFTSPSGDRASPRAALGVGPGGVSFAGTFE